MTFHQQNEKIQLAEINRRLKLLFLADQLNSVEEACRQTGFTVEQFSQLKKRYDQLGKEGLYFQFNEPSNHPMSTAVSIQERIRSLSIENPTYGAQHLSRLLAEHGVILSSATVHKILDDLALSKRRSRWIFLENLMMQENIKLQPNQIEFINEMNPCHAAKEFIGKMPGEIMVQDYFLLYNAKTKGKFYAHVIIDTFSNLVFTSLEDDILPLSAMQLLQNKVLKFYQNQNLHIKNILTHNGRTFSGNAKHDYRMLLAKQRINHLILKNPGDIGFSHRFKFIVNSEFLPVLTKELKLNIHAINFESIRHKFEEWLAFYNNKRGHFGFPNFSAIPKNKHTDWLEAHGFLSVSRKKK